MDMKKILQAIDGVTTKPVEGSKDMAKFVSVIREANVSPSTKVKSDDTDFKPILQIPKAPALPKIQLQPGDNKLGNGVTITVNNDGSKIYSSGNGSFYYNDKGKPYRYRTPVFSGLGQDHDLISGNITVNYNVGPMSLSAKYDKNGKTLDQNASYDLGIAIIKAGIDVNGIKTKMVTPRSAETEISSKDVYAMGDKDKEATYDRAMAQVNQTDESVSMARLLQLVTEGAGPLNRLTQAESIAVYHTSPVETRETITSPVLNIAVGAKPSMIGKYFRTVEQEFAESAERTKQKATKLADKVIEGLKDPKDNPCWKGYKPVGTKKKGGKTVPNCVPK